MRDTDVKGALDSLWTILGGKRRVRGNYETVQQSEMRRMPLIEDRIKVGRCYGMTIGGKLIVAKVVQIYPLDIGVKKNPVRENVVRWAWKDAAGSGKWTDSPGWLLPAFAFAADKEIACDGFNSEQS